MRASKPAIWLFIAIAVYSLGQLLWYWQTPLGQMPVLDGQENLIIADTLADGSLEREPFFRAILYPAILALLPVHWMPLGLLCHLANAGLAYRIARKLWTNRIGAAVTAGLVGFNPVMLHFAFDPLDTLFSISLFLVALNLATPDPSNPKPFEAKRYFWAGLAIALATLARPHFLALLLPAVLYASYLAIARANYRNAAASFALASVFPLIAFGVYQKIRNDSFAILPTQGAYNLWANNRPGANGLYLTQSLNFHYVGEHQNPTKLESEALYMQETGSAGTIEERGAYWRSKAIDHILENPTDWFSLMGFKLYAWLNNVEQYNNKTYAFHKELSPWLRYNPIGWGLLLLGAALALPTLLSQNRSRAIAGLSIVALYSGAALLYMASARFRLPLVPLLAIAAGGAPLCIAQWRAILPSQRLFMGILAIGAALAAFTRFGEIASKRTYPQDAMLLADASSRIGDDSLAFEWAQRALELDDQREDARRLGLLSFYNLAIQGREAETTKSWSDFRDDIERIRISDPYIDFAKGVCLWNLGRKREAANTWNRSYRDYGWNASSSLAALLFTDSPLPDAIPSYPKDLAPANPLLVYALNREKARFLKQRVEFSLQGSPELYANIEQSLQRVLPRAN